MDRVLIFFSLTSCNSINAIKLLESKQKNQKKREIIIIHELRYVLFSSVNSQSNPLVEDDNYLIMMVMTIIIIIIIVKHLIIVITIIIRRRVGDDEYRWITARRRVYAILMSLRRGHCPRT